MLLRSGFLTVLAFGFSSWLSTASCQDVIYQKLFDSFQAPWLKVVPNGTFIEATPDKSGNHILKLAFGNTPSGKMLRANPEDCSALQLEHTMTQYGSDVHKMSLATQQFFSHCEKSLARFAPTRYGSLLRLGQGNYPLEGRPYLRELILSLPYRTTVHALLAMKDFARPRPMVVFICGTGCNLSDATTRLFLAEVFDESPFNVLILPSLSGFDFIRDNQSYGLGGFEEGRQTFEIIRLMGAADSPLRPYISSFHVLGVSLGGNGALFTSVYGSYNNHDLAGPKIQSVTAYCPVVDLKTSFMDLDRNDITGRYFTGLLAETIVKNFGRVFGSDHEMPGLFKPGNQQSVPFIEKYVYPRYKQLSGFANFQLAPFNQGTLDTPQSYWYANNFLNFYQNVTIPTLLWYSRDDFIVNPKHNSIRLAEALEKNPNDEVNVIAVEKGSHCSAGVIYGDDVLSGIVRNFILSQSPEFRFKDEKSMSLDSIPGSTSLTLTSADQKFFGYNWKVNRNRSDAQLNFKIWDPTRKISENDLCSTWSPFYAFEGCFRQVSLNIPLENFFNRLEDQRPRSVAQTQALTRWLNSRVRLLDPDGREPIDSFTRPTRLAWISD